MSSNTTIEINKLDEQIRILEQKKRGLIAKRRSETIIAKQESKKDNDSSNKKQKPTKHPITVKISIGASSTSMDYHTFNSINKRHVMLGGILYQASEDLKTLTPLKCYPGYKDANGCSSTIAVLNVESAGITCTKVGGAISESNRVFVNETEFIEKACDQSINDGWILAGTKVLVPKK